MTIDSVKPQRRALTDWAIERLYDLIYTGVLPAGADLGEEELRVQLGVSRTTVSAALRQLELDGLATVAAANGRRVVASFGVDDVQDLYSVRAVLEEFAIGQAAPNAGEELLATLETLQSEMENLAREPRDPSRRDFGVDFDFHRAIANSSGSIRVEAALLPIWNQTHALLRHAYSLGVYGDREEDEAAYRDHLEIITALRARDATRAVTAMREHLLGRRDQLIAGLRSRGSVV